MGKNRTINTKMWSDRKVTDKFTSEDKLMWLYLLTNDSINNLGCYKISINKIGFDTGFTKNTIENILLRFMDYHDVIIYDNDTNEILIKNYSKYNWTSSPMYRKSIEKLLDEVESKTLIKEIKTIISDFYGDEKTSKTSGSNGLLPFEASVEQELENDVKQVIDIYNQTMNKNLTYKNKNTNDMIRARLKEGHTVEQFSMVISFKKQEWETTEYAKYLIPSTLFAPSKFSNYLLQSEMVVKKQNPAEKIKDRWGDFLSE